MRAGLILGWAMMIVAFIVSLEASAPVGSTTIIVGAIMGASLFLGSTIAIIGRVKL